MNILVTGATGPVGAEYSNLTDILRTQDACLWCLGISQSQVNREQYHMITYDYAVAAGKAMLKANPDMTFLFLSREGTDPTEKSRTLFARVKGKTENALQKLVFKKLYIARPGGMRPINKNQNTAFFNKVMIPLFPFFELITPFMVINSVQLAKAMLHIIKTRQGQVVFNNRELKTIALELNT